MRREFSVSSWPSIAVNVSNKPSLSFRATFPVKPSQTITSTSPLKMSRPSTLPMKLIGARFRDLNDFLRQFVSLRVFFADGQQADARPANSEDRARIDVAHDGELLQVQRLAIDVGADIEKNAGLPFCVGRTVESAGRSTTGRVPTTNFAVAITAPVLPALTTPETLPSRIRCAQHGSKNPSCGGRPSTAESSMVTTSLAWTISIGKPAASCLSSRGTHADPPGRPERWGRRTAQQPGRRHPLRRRAHGRCPWHQRRS